MAGTFRELVVKKITRSPHWSKARNAWILLNPSCVNCGKSPKFLRKYRLQVHHIVPFHVDPSRELDPTNLCTLCSNPRCHLDKGHLGWWKSWNYNVIEDCAMWLYKYETRPVFNGKK